MFNDSKSSRIIVEDVDKPWKSDPSKVNKTRRFYLKSQKSKGYFELVKDHEDGFYSVHFKPVDSNNPNAFTEEEKSILFQAVADAIPTGGKISTWGELSKGGIAGLNRFADLGFTQTGTRNVKMKSGEDVSIPIFTKGGSQSVLVKIEQEMEEIKQRAIADGTFMKVTSGKNKGKKSNLNERQWLQVRTKAFKNWFGDWENDPDNASKVVDENGEPLVVYRASRWAGLKNPPAFAGNGDYVIFDKSRNSSGFFFTNRKSAEERYTGRNLRAFFLNSRNPDISNNFNMLQADREYSINMEYDAVLFAPDKEGVNGDNFEVKVFEPNQIKSATGNIGTFSTEDDRIDLLKTEDGEVYGFVYQGEIYMDETMLDPQVPIHEYTHIWDAAVMQSNPGLWERGKRLLRDSKNSVLRKLWNEIAESDAYGRKWQTQGKTEEELDNLIAGEVHARLVGERGAELLEQIEKAEGGKGIIGKLKNWLKDVFKHLAKTFGTWNEESLNSLTLEDFINMPLRDFVDGINPNNYLQDQNNDNIFEVINKAAESGEWTGEALNQIDNLAKQIENGRHLPKRFSQRESRALRGILAEAEALITTRGSQNVKET